MPGIHTAKAMLRKEIKKKLSEIPPFKKKIQSENVVKKLFKLPVFQRSARISVFLSTEDEICTEPIIKAIFASGKCCYIPRYNKSVMEMVKLHSMKDWKELPVTKWNIKQPHITEQRDNALTTGGLDLIIVPGVAFTADGKRLGHGKGYYDIYLNQFHNKPVTVALAFKQQILADVPTVDHDVKIDYVLYDN